MPIRTILVVQGAEYQAVCRGLRRVGATPEVMPLPIGQTPVQNFLQTQWRQGRMVDRSPILVMGLCGSLQPAYSIGHPLLYDQVGFLSPSGVRIDRCNPQLTMLLQQKLGLQTVKAWSSDRFIHSVQTRQHLRQVHQVDVVDMEGAAIFAVLAESNVAIAMLRVVSDDCNHDLPDVSSAISSAGDLRPGSLLWTMLRQPIGAFRLIRGVNVGLKALEDITANLFKTGV